MTLQSVSYLLFLVLAWGLVRTLPAWRPAALLGASYLFYASWSPTFLLLLIGSSLANYACGIVLRRRSSPWVLWAGILGNLGLLASFKYATLLLPALGIGTGGNPARLLTPIGLSFFTFQAMSYLLDIYRGHDGRPSTVEFLLYMAFWPTILSGPICRAGEMVPQFRQGTTASYEDVAAGCRRILIGLFMKMVLADTLARGIDVGEGVSFGFDRILGGWGAMDVVLLAVGFGFQLFFDFAGYSHIAIGSARLFGIRLRENFDKPYLTTTPSEFWTRWHMSLSSWIRDYLFFPLAAARKEAWWRNFSLVVSMAAFGIWHGVGATFLVWGLYQGCLLVAHRQVQAFRRRVDPVLPAWLDGILCWTVTFSAISLGWLLFRSNSLGQAWAMIGTLLSPHRYGTLALRPNFYITVLLCVGGYFAWEALARSSWGVWERPAVARLAWLASPAAYALAIIAVLAWSKHASTFVYFQF